MMLETLWQDFRFGVRMLMRKPGFTTVVVLTLALGIGANTAIFSVINGVLLRPLGFEEPERLFMVWTDHQDYIGDEGASLPDFLDWRSQTETFEDMAAVWGGSMSLIGEGQAERIIAMHSTASFFPLLGTQLQAGRTFTPEENSPDAEKVAILSDGLWQRRFGGDPAILGETINLNGELYSVVGIAPEGFGFLWRPDFIGVWLPFGLDTGGAGDGRRSDFLSVVGRLKPGVTREQAQAELDTITGRLAQEYPDTNTGIGARMVPLQEQIVGDVQPALLVLWGAVAFVLLIACVNVANLLLARSAARDREVAVRAALGAGRFRLVRQLLTESVLLSLLGGGAGLLLASWGTDLLVQWSPGNLPRVEEIRLDGWTFGFTVAVSVFAGLLFGLAPALQFSRPDLTDSLKGSGRSAAQKRGQNRVRSLLVISEVALSLVLLAGAGLMLRSFQALREVNPGFNPEKLLVARVVLPAEKYSSDEQRLAFHQQWLERLRALPGVSAATGIDLAHIVSGNNFFSFGVEGRPDPPLNKVVDANVRGVMPGFYRTLEIPVRQGRVFTSEDRPQSKRVVVINQSMVRRYFANENPIGQRIAFDGNDDEPTWREIVGVVGDVKQVGVAKEPYPEIYLPMPQLPRRYMTVMVRTEGDPLSWAGAVRGAVKELDPQQPVYGIQTMEDAWSGEIARSGSPPPCWPALP